MFAFAAHIGPVLDVVGNRVHVGRWRGREGGNHFLELKLGVREGWVGGGFRRLDGFDRIRSFINGESG